MSVKIEGNKPEGIPTRGLTDDQRGWAMERFPRYYNLKNARWKINPDKPAIPIPVRSVVPVKQEVPVVQADTEDNKPRRRRRHG